MKPLLTVLLALLTGPVLALSAKAYIVMDMNGEVLAELNPDEQRSIASITKLITADRNATLEQAEPITITRADVRLGQMRRSPLRAGDVITRGQLIELALVYSDNVAAYALGRSSELELGLPPNTQIVEPSGLYAANKSTAREVATIAQQLYHTELAAVSVQPTVSLRRWQRFNTNPLINKEGWSFYLSKTGFTTAAGGCLVVITEVKERLLTFVLLGSRDGRSRWLDLYELRRQLDDGTFAVPEWRRPKAKRAARRGRR